MPDGITIAGSSTSGQALVNSLPTIYREFRLLNDATGIMKSCAQQMNLMPHEGSTKYINNYGRLQAYSVADGQDIAQAQTLSDAATPFSPSEVAVQTLLSGRTMERVADPDLMSRTAQILNNAIDLKQDADGCATLATYTATTIGGAGQVISPGMVAGAAARVKIGNDRVNPEPPTTDIFCVLHPMSAHTLAGRMIPYVNPAALTTPYGVAGGAHLGVEPGVGARSGMSDDLIKRGFAAIGMLGDAIVKTDPNISVSGADATGAVFAKESMIYVQEKPPQLKWDLQDVSMRGGAEGNAWISYVWGTYRGSKLGNPLTVDASFPTS